MQNGSLSRAIDADPASGQIIELASRPIERLYDIAEVALMFKISKDTARRLFRREPGVFVMQSEPSKFKRRYVTIRVPESVLMRVYRRHLHVAA